MSNKTVVYKVVICTIIPKVVLELYILKLKYRSIMTITETCEIIIVTQLVYKHGSAWTLILVDSIK